MIDPNALEVRVAAAYQASGCALGWRLLYSPVEVLNGAEVAFLGLQPGGRHWEQGKFAMPSGSAYVDERWGSSGRHNGLQVQVQSLFASLGVSAEKVLAGNLVPFRSGAWADLPSETKRFAIAFGREIWQQILSVARPGLIVTCCGDVETSVAQICDATFQKKVSVGWGTVTARRYRHRDGALVALPHLSRYGLMTREKSAAGLAEVFEGYWRL